MIDWPLAELLPHAGDMILIDQVLAFDDEQIHTRLTVRAGGLFNREDGSLPAWVGVELMAQSVAAYAGCRARLLGDPVVLGFCSARANLNATLNTSRRAPSCTSTRCARWKTTTAWACSSATSPAPASMPPPA